MNNLAFLCGRWKIFFVIIVFTSYVSEAFAQNINIEKLAYDEFGNQITGPVSLGDTIKYVINVTSDGAAQLSVEDTISASQEFVSGSLSANEWQPNGNPLFNNNAEVFNQQGQNDLFTLNVPVETSGVGIASVGGDGTIPIPVGQKIYSVFHHERFQDTGTIFCWDLFTLQQCPGTWPRNATDEDGNSLATPNNVHHFVSGNRIYFGSTRQETLSNGATTVVPGAGCWDTTIDNPCTFVSFRELDNSSSLLPNSDGSMGSQLNPEISMQFAGIVGISSSSSSPNDRVYLQANNSLYCRTVPSGSSCPGWSNPFIPTAQTGGNRDIFLDDFSVSKRIFISSNSSNTANSIVASCFLASNGSPCGAWPATGILLPNKITHSISPGFDNLGDLNAICFHNFVASTPHGLYNPNGLSTDVTCLRHQDGTPIGQTDPDIPKRIAYEPFHMLGGIRVLYPRSSVAPAKCIDYSGSQPQVCGDFTPTWSNNTYADYGYSLDPAAPGRCFLGLGHWGRPWRFSSDGTLVDSQNPNICRPFVYQKTFDFDDMFCGPTPNSIRWTHLELVNAPMGSERSGTIEIFDANGNLVQSIPLATVVGNNIPLLANTTTISALLGPLTVIYTSDPNIDRVTEFEIKLHHSSNLHSQICYQTVVSECGMVSNTAELTSPNLDTISTLADLGLTAGAQCGISGATVKVCKVAGEGVEEGELFDFGIGWDSQGQGGVTVPAGPAPDGYCQVIATNVPTDREIAIGEIRKAGFVVTDIVAAGAGNLSIINPIDRAITFSSVSEGVTEVTFTNEYRTGFLEICKVINEDGQSGSSTFEIEETGQSYTIPANSCTAAIEVPAGNLTINETVPAGWLMAGCIDYDPISDAINTDKIVQCDLDAGRMVIHVPSGDISQQTIGFVFNVRDETTSRSQSRTKRRGRRQSQRSHERRIREIINGGR